jgi:hypothetical protein
MSCTYITYELCYENIVYTLQNILRCLKCAPEGIPSEIVSFSTSLDLLVDPCLMSHLITCTCSE